MNVRLRRLVWLACVGSLGACAQTDVIAQEVSAASAADAGVDASSPGGVCVATRCNDFEDVSKRCEDRSAHVSIGDGCSDAEPSRPASRYAVCTCTEYVSTHSLVLDAWDSRSGGIDTSSTFTPEVGSGDACACDASTLFDIESLVEAHANDNDDAALGLAANTFDGFDSTGDAPAIELGCGRYYFDGVHGSGSSRWHVTGHAMVFVGGDFAVDDEFEATLEKGASLDLFVSGNVRASKTFVLGDESSAGDARLYIGGNGTLDIGGDAVIAGGLYAPRVEMATRGEITLYGPLFVRRAAPLADVVVHFDRAALEPATCALSR